MKRAGIRFLSFLLVVTITFTSSYSYAYPTLFKTTSHAQRHVKDDNTDKVLNILENPSTVSIPSRIGRIVEHFKGKEDSLIIHIQDRHADKTAQLNIAKIIDEFATKYDTNLMCLEGASKELDTSFYDKFTDGETKKKVSEFFVEKALFTGAEYYKITNKEKYLKVFGAEDRDTYLQHLAAYKDNVVDKDRILKFLKAVSVSIDILKNKIYTKALKEIDEKSRRYAEKEIQLPEYLKTLETHSKKEKLDTSKYKNLNKFVQFIEQEERIDFKEAESQREALIKKLSESLDKEKLDSLLQNSLQFRLGKITQEEFYDYLKSLIEQESLERSNYKNLLAYCEYIAFSKTINHLAVFDEAEDLEEELMLYLCKTQAQKDLVLYSKSTKLLYALYSLKLVRRQLNYLDNQPQYSDIYNIQQFLAKSYDQYGLRLSPVITLFKIDQESINSSKKYYKLALKRDIALIDNTLKRMQRNRKDRALLITGGFHTGGITNILKEKDISYIVICPTIGTGDCEKVYSARMEGNLPDISELNSALSSMLVAPLVAGDVVDKTSSSGIKELFAAAFEKAESKGRDIAQKARDFDIGISSDDTGGKTRGEHLGFHAVGRFSEIIDMIAIQVRAKKLNGEWDLRSVVEKAGGRIETSDGELRLENDGILTVIDRRFRKDHAGRGRFAIFARNQVKAQHELKELRSWRDFAVKELNILSTEEVRAGYLGKRLRKWMNQSSANADIVRDKAKLFHEQALREEFQFAMGDEIDRQEQRLTSQGNISFFSDKVRNLLSNLDEAIVENIGEGIHNEVVLRIHAKGEGIVVAVNKKTGALNYMAVNPGGDVLDFRNANSTMSYQMVPEEVSRMSSQQILDFLQEKGIENLKFRPGMYEGAVMFSLVNPYTNKEEIWNWFHKNDLFRYVLSRVNPKRLKNRALYGQVHLLPKSKQERDRGGVAIDVAGKAARSQVRLDLKVLRMIRGIGYLNHTIGPMTHEIIHQLLFDFSDETLAKVRDEMRPIIEKLRGINLYKDYTDVILDNEAITRVLTAISVGEADVLGVRVTDNMIKALNNIGVLENSLSMSEATRELKQIAESQADTDFIIAGDGDGISDLAGQDKAAEPQEKPVKDFAAARESSYSEITYMITARATRGEIKEAEELTNRMLIELMQKYNQDDMSASNLYVLFYQIRAGLPDEVVEKCARPLSAMESFLLGLTIEQVRVDEEKATGYNVEKLFSKEFEDVLFNESMGGNAGTNHIAVNAFVDQYGRIVAVGNRQNINRKGLEEQYGLLTSVTFRLNSANRKYETPFYEVALIDAEGPDLALMQNVLIKATDRANEIIYSFDKRAMGAEDNIDDLIEEIKRRLKGTGGVITREIQLLLNRLHVLKVILWLSKNAPLVAEKAKFLKPTVDIDEAYGLMLADDPSYPPFIKMLISRIAKEVAQLAGDQKQAAEFEKEDHLPSQSDLEDAKQVRASQLLPFVDRQVVAIGDIHGNLKGARDILEAAGLIKKGKAWQDDVWIGESRILITPGDIMDRGQEAKQAREWLANLRNQARQNRGDIIRLLGNHDIAHIRGQELNHMDEENREFWKEAGRGDFENGVVRAAVVINGRLWIHGMLGLEMESALREEIASTLQIEEDDVTKDMIAERINEIVEKAIRYGSFTHEIFENHGIFWHRIREAKENALLFGDISPIDLHLTQGFGHDVQKSVVLEAGHKLLGVDIGMVAGNLGWAELTPDGAIYKCKIENNGVRRELLERGRGDLEQKEASEVGQQVVPEWIAEDLWKAFVMINGNRPVAQINIEGNFDTTLEQLKQKMDELSDDEVVAIKLINEHPDRTDYRVVIDKVSHIKKTGLALWMGKVSLMGYEFLLDFSKYKGHSTVHVHDISLGRIYTEALQGKGLMSSTFSKIVDIINNTYPSEVISAVALNPVVEHWFKKYFNAHFASDEEYERVCGYVNVDFVDKDKVMVAQGSGSYERDIKFSKAGETETVSKTSSAGLALKHIAALKGLCTQYLNTLLTNSYGDMHFGQTPNKYGLIIYDSTLKGDEKEMIETIASLKGSRGNKFEIVVIPSNDGRNLIKDWKIAGDISFTEQSNAVETAKILSKTRPVGVIAGVEADPEAMIIEINAEKRDGKHVFITSQEPASIEEDGKTIESFIAFEVIFADIMSKFKTYDANKKYSLAELAVILPAVTSVEFIQMIEALKHTMDELEKAA